MYKKGNRRAALRAICVFVVLNLISLAVWGETKVAIIDSGVTEVNKFALCKTGHFDFITDTPTVGLDTINHGSVISSIISDYTNTCQVVFKVFKSRDQNISYIADAVLMAIDEKVAAINLSASGRVFDEDEYYALNKAIKAGIRVFVPSGNKKLNLNKGCIVYPACYTQTDNLNLIVVGSSDNNTLANTGKIIDQYEAFCYKDTCGTSMSTAYATGKYLKGLRTITGKGKK